MIKRWIRAWLTFGGGGGSQTTVQQNYSPEEAARRAKLFGIAEDIYNSQVANGTPPYPGAKPIGPSPETTQAQNMITSTVAQNGQNISNLGANALKFGFSDVLNPTSNPALQGTLDTATRRLSETYTDPGGVISQIRSNFMEPSGGQSSREALAMGLAGRNFNYALGDTTAEILNNAYNKGLDTFSRTMALAPNAYNLMLQPAMSLASVGENKEGYQQANADYNAAAQQWQYQAPWQMLQPYANTIQGLSNPMTVTTTPMAKANPAMGTLGGAAMGAYVGSIVPGVGTAVGAGAGAILGLLGSGSF